MQNKECPTCKKRDKVHRHGKFRRSSDCQSVQRFNCCRCKKTFSYATTDPECWQKKRRINYPLQWALASNVSQRRAAIMLNVSRSTVARRLPFFGKLAQEKMQKSLCEFVKKEPITTLEFDELQTIEHTKCKPLSVAVVVNPKTRHILGVSVSKMPATGHLAKISRKKYGKRPDERRKGISSLFKYLSPIRDTVRIVKSDQHPYYPPLVSSAFPKASHKQYPSEPSAITGQGELKKKARDPLFYINHTLAMLRAGICRLIRKTWCTTKKPERLLDHLWSYIWIHNQKLMPTPIRS